MQLSHNYRGQVEGERMTRGSEGIKERMRGKEGGAVREGERMMSGSEGIKERVQRGKEGGTVREREV